MTKGEKIMRVTFMKNQYCSFYWSSKIDKNYQGFSVFFKNVFFFLSDFFLFLAVSSHLLGNQNSKHLNKYIKVIYSY